MNEKSAFGARAARRVPGVSIVWEAPGASQVGLESGVPLFVGFVSPKPQPERNDARDRLTVDGFSEWREFREFTRSVDCSGFLDYAVRGFFENGGRRCRVLALPCPRTGLAMYQALQTVLGVDGADSGLLEDVDDVDLVCVPDVLHPELRRIPGATNELQHAVLAYCSRMGDRFAILDGPPLIAEAAQRVDSPLAAWSAGRIGLGRQVLERRRAARVFEGPVALLRDGGLFSYGALYVPWIRVHPEARHARAPLVPVSGHIAGAISRTDERSGYWKAPANELLEGVLDLDSELDPNSVGELLDIGVNALRSIPGHGMRIWGARTLALEGHLGSIPARRTVLMLRRWLERNMLDLVMEPNDSRLWQRVRSRLEGHLYRLFRRGALRGNQPGEAYFVKCDAETNPLEQRENGVLVAELGLAAVATLEFIVVRVGLGRDGAARLEFVGA